MISPIQMVERRLVPDFLIRLGIRGLLARSTRRHAHLAAPGRDQELQEFAESLRDEPIAICTGEANDQHYEVPAEFFVRTLGPHLKYSCCLWDDAQTLAEAERAMLRLTARRAEISDGMRILDLGCGWGSFTLWAAENFPAARLTAVSNSAGQRRFILDRARQRGLSNVEVITANVADFDTGEQFDRVVSIEMFEHVRNYERLLGRIRNWLVDDGRLFVHIFCHRQFAYRFGQGPQADWMSRNFFSGGLMPSFDLLSQFNRDMQMEKSWWLSGRHYARTCEAWLARCDAQRGPLERLLSNQHGPTAANIQLQRWRMFFMACAELFAYDAGRQWGVGHYRLAKA